MNGNVVKRHPLQMYAEEFASCATLNMGKEGDMINVLTEKAKIVPDAYTYYLWKYGNVVYGWAILTRRLNGEHEVDFFVRADQRGRGIGTELMLAINADVDRDQLIAYPFDAAGRKFFKHHGIKTRDEWDGGDIRVPHVSEKIEPRVKDIGPNAFLAILKEEKVFSITRRQREQITNLLLRQRNEIERLRLGITSVVDDPASGLLPDIKAKLGGLCLDG